MKPIALALAASLLLAACGGDKPADQPADKPADKPAAPAQAPAATDFTKPESVATAYMEAAKAPDEAAMLALGTEEWRKREKTWRKSFTSNIIGQPMKLKSYAFRETVIDEATPDLANVSFGAVFVGPDGKDDREGMRFVLAKKDGRWWITELH